MKREGVGWEKVKKSENRAKRWNKSIVPNYYRETAWSWVYTRLQTNARNSRRYITFIIQHWPTLVIVSSILFPLSARTWFFTSFGYRIHDFRPWKSWKARRFGSQKCASKLLPSPIPTLFFLFLRVNFWYANLWRKLQDLWTEAGGFRYASVLSLSLSVFNVSGVRSWYKWSAESYYPNKKRECSVANPLFIRA